MHSWLAEELRNNNKRPCCIVVDRVFNFQLFDGRINLACTQCHHCLSRAARYKRCAGGFNCLEQGFAVRPEHLAGALFAIMFVLRWCRHFHVCEFSSKTNSCGAHNLLNFYIAHILLTMSGFPGLKSYNLSTLVVWTCWLNDFNRLKVWKGPNLRQRCPRDR